MATRRQILVLKKQMIQEIVKPAQYFHSYLYHNKRKLCLIQKQITHNISFYTKRLVN